MPTWPPIDPGDESKRPEERSIFECVQGYVTLEDASGEEDGGLVVVDRGHTLHQAYFAQSSPRAGNSHMLKPDFLRTIDSTQFPVHPVKAPKGAMVLWYSRTPHQGKAPSPLGNPRAVIYVCHAPKALLTPLDRQV